MRWSLGLLTNQVSRQPLRDENTRLRKLVADLSLDKGRLAVGDLKKRLELVALKAAIGQMQQDYAFP